MKNRLERILLDLIHSHCQNCDGGSPLIADQDEADTAQSKADIIALMREIVPKEKNNSNLVRVEGHLSICSCAAEILRGMMK